MGASRNDKRASITTSKRAASSTVLRRGATTTTTSTSATNTGKPARTATNQKKKRRSEYSITWTPSPSPSPRHKKARTVESRLEALENDDDGEVVGDVCCHMCGQTPCEWITVGSVVEDAILEEFDIRSAATSGAVVKKASGEKVPNNSMRFVCYKMFIAEKYGHLGRGNRI